ncbi:hypothetical protein FSP39_022843, partial [Pinctada imbricata]
ISDTEIDWVAYMQEVEGVVNGTYDYTKLKGDTGPLVYPAGFVYIYLVLYYVTNHGINIRLGQYIFAALYIASLIVIFDIYRRAKKIPPYVLFFMCCASYRIHSIYILRLFNDPIAMFLLYLAVDFFIMDRWMLGCLFYSLGVSVKMNVLLFSPALLMLLMIRHGTLGTIKHLIVCAAPQVMLAAPFLLSNPAGYIIMSFNFGRQFFYKWTVNWRLLPEEIFLNKYFQTSLLVAHILVLVLFFILKWKSVMSLTFSIDSMLDFGDVRLNSLSKSIFFQSNFIGMCFSRSLHYQFYVWYFHTLHYLLWSTTLPSVIKILLLGVIELSWNTYPSTVTSSSLLHVCHIIILYGLWNSPAYTVTKQTTAAQKMK